MAKYNRIVTPRGVAVYPHLHAPDFEFDSAGIFDTKLRLDTSDPQVQAFMKAVKKEYKAYAKKAKIKVRKDGLPWSDDSENEGCILVKAKMKHNVTPRDGEPFTQTPMIVDAQKNELAAGLRIGAGSELKLSVLMVPYKGFGGGVSLRLLAVQVLELVEFTSDYGFDEEDGFAADSAEDDDPFGDTSDDDLDDDDDDDEFDIDDEEDADEDDYDASDF